MYVLMGANGNITSRAARLLLDQSRPVRVIGRSASNLAPLRERGAELAVGDASDAGFLADAFAGATALYAMVPSDYAAPDLRKSMERVGTAIAEAIARSGVRRVVNLSSIGAELATGTGPIVALHHQERRLDALTGLDLLHLRPGYCMENHLAMAPVVAALGLYPSLERSDVPVPMVATADVAAVVARELVGPGRRGILHLHAPRSYSFAQAAQILGGAIGRPGLRHVQTPQAEGIAALVEAGFSADAADCMAEMARWLSDRETGPLPGPVEIVATTLEAFAPRFREAVESIAGATAPAGATR
jgi:uncharacterized protein YbjT (DUF2867 family)